MYSTGCIQAQRWKGTLSCALGSQIKLFTKLPSGWLTWNALHLLSRTHFPPDPFFFLGSFLFPPMPLLFTQFLRPETTATLDSAFSLIPLDADDSASLSCPVYPSLLLPWEATISPWYHNSLPAGLPAYSLALYLSIQLTVTREPFTKYTLRLQKFLISQSCGLFLSFPTKSNQGSLGEMTDPRCREGNAQHGPRTSHHDRKRETSRFLGTITYERAPVKMFHLYLNHTYLDLTSSSWELQGLEYKFNDIKRKQVNSEYGKVL